MFPKEGKIIAEVHGAVTEGSKKASKLGFPTINIAYHQGDILPLPGVYAGFLSHKGKNYEGVIAFGPSQEDASLKLEIHCFEEVPITPNDSVACSFLKKISDFTAMDEVEMREKIAHDVSEAKAFFER